VKVEAVDYWLVDKKNKGLLEICDFWEACLTFYTKKRIRKRKLTKTKYILAV
jgi:hypothetical protein